MAITCLCVIIAIFNVCIICKFGFTKPPYLYANKYLHSVRLPDYYSLVLALRDENTYFLVLVRKRINAQSTTTLLITIQANIFALYYLNSDPNKSWTPTNEL